MSDILNNKRVLVGMSGGVDSTATCLMLLEQGFDVVGVTMRTWDNPASFSTPDQEEPDYIVEARALAARLGIEHHVADEREDFRRVIVQHFMDEYLQGRTPNPCVMCNPLFKFRVLKEWADRLGCAYVATGHYSQLLEVDGYTYIIIGNDAKKDQSYFLWRLGQEVLRRVIFPLGGYTKDEVRAVAEENGFSSAGKPESQDICFVPDGDYAGFLADRCGVVSPEGDFTDASGKGLGRHKGIVRYTVGQRKGLGVSADRPLYVLRKDIAQNRVILGDNSELYSSVLTAHSLNLIALDRIDSALKVEAKVRYSQKTAKATVDPLGGGRVRVEFEEKQRAVTPGQSVVFYDGDTLVGGAVIE